MTTTGEITSTFTEVPIIDVGPLRDPGASPAELARTAERIGAACRHVGFFYAENHGIPEADRAAMLAETRRFFDLPAGEKLKLDIGRTAQFRGYVTLGGEVTAGKRDWHECLDLQPVAGRDPAGGGHPLDDPDQWPEALPSFRLVMMRAWDQVYELGRRITGGLALSLGLERRYFEAFEGDALCDLRLSHYPPPPAAGPGDDVDAGMGGHCDQGFMTVLQQDAVGGLEVRNAGGAWIPAPHIPGTFLVNIGMMMQRWTNDRYRATWHRVALATEQDRYSMPFFFEPRHDAVIEPLAVCVDADNPPRYEPVVFGEYLDALFSIAYGRS